MDLKAIQTDAQDRTIGNRRKRTSGLAAVAGSTRALNLNNAEIPNTIEKSEKTKENAAQIVRTKVPENNYVDEHEVIKTETINEPLINDSNDEQNSRVDNVEESEKYTEKNMDDQIYELVKQKNVSREIFSDENRQREQEQQLPAEKNKDYAVQIMASEISKEAVGSFITTDLTYVKPPEKEKKSEFMQLKIEPSRKREFKEYCERNNYSMSDIVSSFIYSFLKVNNKDK